jgi:hypothetical protein
MLYQLSYGIGYLRKILASRPNEAAKIETSGLFSNLRGIFYQHPARHLLIISF